MKENTNLIPVELIERKIYLIRGMKVMLNTDLAYLYGIQTFRLNEAVKRNKDRFPKDFMFQVNFKEASSLLSQIAMSKSRGGRRTLPYVFTEQGVAMLASVLKSQKAIQMNIAIVRAFIKLRELLATHKDLVLEIEKIKKEQKGQNQRIQTIIDIISRMINPPVKENAEPIGFSERK